MGMMWRIFYIFILKNGFYCVTFQKWGAKLPGFAIINAWQHFGNRKSASHNKWCNWWLYPHFLIGRGKIQQRMNPFEFPFGTKGEDGYKVFSIRIREEIVAQIDDISSRTGHSRSELIEEQGTYTGKTDTMGFWRMGILLPMATDQQSHIDTKKPPGTFSSEVFP